MGAMKTKIILFIRDLINPKTKIIKYYDDFAGWIYGTECCGVAPITNEKYCPNCGRKIIKKH